MGDIVCGCWDKHMALEMRGGAVIDGLEKGMEIKVASRIYSVLSKTDKGLRLKRNDGKSLTIKTICNQNYGNLLVENLFRDIEGDILVDLININNKFHAPSQSYVIGKAQAEKKQQIICKAPVSLSIK
jgi:hypothetical protein